MVKLQRSMEKPWLKDLPPLGKFRYIDLYAKGRTALDIGAGLGWCSDYLEKKEFEVTAFDLENDLRFMNIKFIQGSVDHLPFANQSFDTVLAFDVLEHVKDEDQAWQGIARVTKKRLIMSVPNSEDKILRRYNLTYKHHTDKSHYREYSLLEVKERLESSGFKVIYLDQQGPVDPVFIAQFLKPNAWAPFYETAIRFFGKTGLIRNEHFFADIYAVAEK